MEAWTQFNINNNNNNNNNDDDDDDMSRWKSVS